MVNINESILGILERYCNSLTVVTAVEYECDEKNNIYFCKIKICLNGNINQDCLSNPYILTGESILSEPAGKMWGSWWI